MSNVNHGLHDSVSALGIGLPRPLLLTRTDSILTATDVKGLSDQLMRVSLWYSTAILSLRVVFRQSLQTLTTVTDRGTLWPIRPRTTYEAPIEITFAGQTCPRTQML